MSDRPRVSVVMAVYNGGHHLAETLDSVLGQQGCDFELIVVNDGSRDSSAGILADYAARDLRLRVIEQSNAGLTRALVRGCAEARGDYIARQDAGDISLPGRLVAQQRFLDDHPEAVMTACSVRFSGPEREALFETERPGEQLDAGLRKLDLASLQGPPHHGATMFRRMDYLAVGGYRLPFAVAQDIDLWLRLAERGACLGLAEFLYEARMEAGNISSRRRDEQFRMGRLAIECARRRRAAQDEQELLLAWRFAPPAAKPLGRRERARFNYFVASCLRERNPMAAKRYYRLALRDDPLHFKALLRLLAG